MKQFTLQKHHFIIGLFVPALIVLGIALLMARADDKKAAEQAATVKAAALPLPSPEALAQAYGGLSARASEQQLVTRVGHQLTTRGDAAKLGRPFRFYVLADQSRNNVFALPDGTVFITTLLLNHLKTEAQLAGLLAREVAHVAAGHEPLFSVSAVLTYTPEQVRGAEVIAVHYMAQAGYDPRALGETLAMLEGIHATTALELFATSPTDAERAMRLEGAIRKEFPNGVPDSLSK